MMKEEEEILLIELYSFLVFFWWFMGKGSGRFVEHKLADPLVNESVWEPSLSKLIETDKNWGRVEPRRRRKEFAFEDKVWYSQEVMIKSADNTWRRRWPGVKSGFLLWRCVFWRWLLRANWSTGMGFMPGHEWRGQRFNGGLKAYSATLGPCLLKMLLDHKDNDDELCWTTS